jgi:peptidoglycan/LPS O-acetylase OafA/YrhL
MPVRSFYKPELDVLRFFAFLAVFVFHIVNYSTDFLVQHHVPFLIARIGVSLTYAGMYGVSLFFILSAYLITELLLREKESMGRLDVGAFYLRRILRIWPLYYLFVALVAIVPFMNPRQVFSTQYVLAFLVLMGNWSLVLFGIRNFVAVTLWSVAVEEQFYLLWPPVVARLSHRQIGLAALGMICVANIVRPLLLAMHQSREQVWMNSFSQLDSIAFGILLAVRWPKKSSPLKYGVRLALLVSGIACLAVVAFFANPDGAFSPLGTLIGSPAIPVASTAILLSFFDLPFRLPLLQYLGKISYGLYVYHMAALFVVDRLFPGDGAGAAHACVRFVFALGLTLLTAVVSYTVVEAPFLKLKRRFTYVSSRPV